MPASSNLDISKEASRAELMAQKISNDDPPFRVRAFADWAPMTDGEVALVVGCEYTVIAVDGRNVWWQTCVSKDGTPIHDTPFIGDKKTTIGWFPAAYVERIPSPAPFNTMMSQSEVCVPILQTKEFTSHLFYPLSKRTSTARTDFSIVCFCV